MNSLIFSSSGVPEAPKDNLDIDSRLRAVIKKLTSVDSYEYDAAFMHAPADDLLRTLIHELVKKKEYQNVDIVIVVGIGGSNLAVKAIHDLLQHTTSFTSNKRIFFAETVDPEYTNALYQTIDSALATGQKVVLVISTKSGTTTETVALASIFIECFKFRYKKEYNKYIVVITDSGSPMADFAHTENMTYLTIPSHVGGRYSAFSAVGLFPLALLGYDIDALCRGARAVNNSLESNDIARSAAITYGFYASGVRIGNMFLFSADAASLGAWYRQLTAESLGKIQTGPTGNRGVGILPIVSIGSTDLHSMVQLYFANPISMLTTFVTFGSSCTLSVPESKDLKTNKTFIAGKTLKTLLSAIETGTMNAYQEASLPFVTLHIKNKSEESIGEFMQWKMIEIVMIAHLLDINPFDQPEVERYKLQTRKILANE